MIKLYSLFNFLALVSSTVAQYIFLHYFYLTCDSKDIISPSSCYMKCKLHDIINCIIICKAIPSGDTVWFIYPCHLAYIAPCQCLSLWDLGFLEIKATHEKLVLSSSKQTNIISTCKMVQNNTFQKNIQYWHKVLTPPMVNHC